MRILDSPTSRTALSSKIIDKSDKELDDLQVRNREELLKNLEAFRDDEIVINGQLKNILRATSAERAEFRGSRYRGVSKNKGKWQVGLSFFLY